MKSFKIKSHAKINLALNVIGKKAKLHKIESIVSFIDLHDLIYLKQIKKKDHKIFFEGKFSRGINEINTVTILMKLDDTCRYLNSYIGSLYSNHLPLANVSLLRRCYTPPD